jgi:hypothetical protein
MSKIYTAAATASNSNSQPTIVYEGASFAKAKAAARVEANGHNAEAEVRLNGERIWAVCKGNVTACAPWLSSFGGVPADGVR